MLTCSSVTSLRVSASMTSRFASRYSAEIRWGSLKPGVGLRATGRSFLYCSKKFSSVASEGSATASTSDSTATGTTSTVADCSSRRK